MGRAIFKAQPVLPVRPEGSDGEGNIQGPACAARSPRGKRWGGQYSRPSLCCPFAQREAMGRAIFKAQPVLPVRPEGSDGEGNIQGPACAVRSPRGKRWGGQYSRPSLCCPFAQREAMGRAIFKAQPVLSVRPEGSDGEGNIQGPACAARSPRGKRWGGQYSRPSLCCPFAQREIEGERAAQAPSKGDGERVALSLSSHGELGGITVGRLSVI